MFDETFAAASYMRPIALLMPAALVISALIRAPRTSLGVIAKAAITTALIFALLAGVALARIRRTP